MNCKYNFLVHIYLSKTFLFAIMLLFEAVMFM